MRTEMTGNPWIPKVYHRMETDVAGMEAAIMTQMAMGTNAPGCLQGCEKMQRKSSWRDINTAHWL